LHENGFKLFSEKMGFRIIFFNDIKKISFLVTVDFLIIDGNTMDDIAT
jgi:hypothetical protein